jgi:tetratricopeptide (TPR) repeat protein
MKFFFAQLAVFGFGLLNSSSLAQIKNSDDQSIVLYKKAVALFNSPKPTAQTDSLAFSKLLYITTSTKITKRNALIFFDCYEKAGIIKQTYGYQRQAIALYKKAIACRFAYTLPDSLLFKPYLYCGSAYYFSNLFDSSLYFLKKSEAILLKFPGQQEAQRLYNSFGALYYESGNYQQGINYFRKAVQLNLLNKQPDNITLLYSYKSNIASAQRKMEQYDAAVSIYKSLIPLRINQNIVFINLGTIYLEKSQPDSALYYLIKVKRADDYNPIILENALGNAYIQKQNLPEAFVHLNRAVALYKKNQSKGESFQKPPAIGITYKLLADAEQQKHKLLAALRNYQQSIIYLDYTFNDPDIYHNPPTVTGGFQNYALFQSLATKANCLAELYKEQPTHKNRSSAIETYKTALRLADYIEKSFDLEDAQLFTVRKVFPVYQEAVTFMIHTFEQTKDETYLEEAFRWTEKSKAIALYINLKENRIKSFGHIPDSLLRKERQLKLNLSRLLIKIDKGNISNQTATLVSEMQDNELALSRLANKLLDYPEYRRQKFNFDSIDLPYLRKNLLQHHRAILSYFQASNAMYCFVLTQDEIHYFKFRKDSLYQQALQDVNTELRTLVPGLAYRGHKNAKLLYNRLIRPAEAYLKNTTSLLIIPHNELGQLPFDVLEDADNTYLLERFDITYQYAASFLRYEVKSKAIVMNNTLSVTKVVPVSTSFRPQMKRLED